MISTEVNPACVFVTIVLSIFGPLLCCVAFRSSCQALLPSETLSGTALNLCLYLGRSSIFLALPPSLSFSVSLARYFSPHPLRLGRTQASVLRTGTSLSSQNPQSRDSSILLSHPRLIKHGPEGPTQSLLEFFLYLRLGPRICTLTNSQVVLMPQVL